MSAIEKFFIENRVVIITGGAGLLGKKHAEAVIEGKGIPVLLDVSSVAIENAKRELKEIYGENCKVEGCVVDITQSDDVEKAAKYLLEKHGHIDVLINNAANNPKVEGNAANMKAIQFENFPLQMWMDDLAVGLRSEERRVGKECL